MFKDPIVEIEILDSVRNNLNGFWASTEQLERGDILWLNFENDANTSLWFELPFNDEIAKTQIIPLYSCQSIVKLFDQNGVTHIQLFSDTFKFDHLSKYRFEIGGTSYVRHEGYNFLH